MESARTAPAAGSSRPGPLQLREECAQCLPPLTLGVFLGRRHFRHGAGLSCWHEGWVIAESAASAPRADDVTFPRAHADQWRGIVGVFDIHHDAAITRRTARRWQVA